MNNFRGCQQHCEHLIVDVKTWAIKLSLVLRHQGLIFIVSDVNINGDNQKQLTRGKCQVFFTTREFTCTVQPHTALNKTFKIDTGYEPEVVYIANYKK